MSNLVFSDVSAAILTTVGASALSTYWGGCQTKSLGAAAAITMLWALVGFSITYSPDLTARVIGGGSFATIDLLPVAPSTVAPWTYSAFAYTLALVLLANSIMAQATSKLAFAPMVLFSLLWTVGTYIPLTHWIFSSTGNLGTIGSGVGYGLIDYAGVHTLHINAGVSSLVLNYWLGGLDHKASAPCTKSFPTLLVGLAAYIAGNIFTSSFTKGVNQGLALVNTQMAVACGAATWAALEIVYNDGKAYFKGSVSASGAITGAVSGLVAISAGAGFVSPMWALFFGFFTSMMVFFAPAFFTTYFPASGINNGYSAFIVHGVGGIFGSALVGLFANQSFQIDTKLNGSFYWGNSVQIGKQAAGISIAIALAAISTSIAYWLVFWALRLSFYPALKSLNEGDEGTEKL